MLDELRVVGKSVPRLDAYEKATGTAKYTWDMWTYGMLYGKVLRSPYAHANVLSVDTSKAEKLEGVRAVLTHQDVPRVLHGEGWIDDAYVLPDKVRFVGDEVVAVAAESQDIAEKALELIDVKYEQLPIVLTPEEAIKPGAPLIPPPETSKSNLLEGGSRSFVRSWGDVDEGFKEAEHVFEDTCKTAFVQYMPIEPRACLAKWDGDELTIWMPSQRQALCIQMIANVLDMPQNKIRAISPYLGGSFGGKYHERYPMIAALLAKKTGRPVMLRFTREEEALSKLRMASTLNVKLGVKKDGIFTATYGEIITASGGYNWSHNADAILSIHGLFRTPNSKCVSRSIYTNHPPTGQLRGVANALMTFAVTQLTDRIAEELGLDPVEFYKKTHIQPGDDCSSMWDFEGVRLSNCGLDECLDKGAEAIGWKKRWKGYKTPLEIRGHKRVGLGVAPMAHHSSGGIFSSASVVKLNLDGTADFFLPVTEMGQGSKTTQTQVLAEASGIPLGDIRVIIADTRVCPLNPRGQVASTSAHTEAIATKLAGEDTRKQILERASGELGEKPEALDIEEGNIYVKSEPQKAITLKELMAKCMVGITPIVGRGAATCPNWPTKARSFGATFAEVEVDMETGELTVLRLVSAVDVGRALNPMIVEGQIEGGAVMALGFILKEELKFDNDGNPLNLDFTDYKIFSPADMPRIESIIVESNDPLGPYGAKGAGEASLIAVYGCIVNAIYNAIGIRFKEIPVTPEMVLNALRGKL